MPHSSARGQALEPHCKCDSIDPATFQRLLDVYPKALPTKLEKLEHARVATIPGALRDRRAAGDPYLLAEEVKELVDWKLSHGTFRPSLQKLVASNPPELVRDTTRQAFAQLPENLDEITTPSFDAKEQVPHAVNKALTTLTSLKGIGPATASLLLSTFAPKRIPFFSDELYRWARFDEPEDKGKGHGWERKIGYTVKEYGSLFDRVQAVRDRLGKEGRDTRALEIEMVAYLLGTGEGGLDQNGEITTDGKGEDTVGGRSAKKRKSGTDQTPTLQDGDASRASIPRKKGAQADRSKDAPKKSERKSKRLRSQ